MPYQTEDTIAAIASAPGQSLRGIIRVSGQDALSLIAKIVAPDCVDPIINAGNQQFQCATKILVADCERDLDALLLVWPTKSSYTGQPAVEIHTLGSLPLLQMVLQSLVDSGCRIAEPGEFTMRAFLCGRLDLTQAEAVLGLIDARNEQQFETSLAQLAGGLAQPITAVKDQLVRILAELEAGLDFVEEDIEFISNEQMLESLNQSTSQLSATIEQLNKRSSASEYTRVILAGLPNAGKSSLFNALADSTAIVSDIAGTTRDYLTADVVFDGTRIRLTDTAGLEELSDSNSIEQQMTQQAQQQIQTADIIVHCVCGQTAAAEFPFDLPFATNSNAIVIPVVTKSDLGSTKERCKDAILTSAEQRTGLSELKSRISTAARELNETSHSLLHSSLRTAENLNQALDAVESAKSAAHAQSGDELVAAEIRSALDQIGRIVGIIYTDDILDVVFSRFCIGK